MIIGGAFVRTFMSMAGLTTSKLDTFPRPMKNQRLAFDLSMPRAKSSTTIGTRPPINLDISISPRNPMACHCSSCSRSKRISTFRALQPEKCSRAKAIRVKEPTKRHLLDKLNHARLDLIRHIDHDEDYKGMLMKRYGAIPKNVWIMSPKWKQREYVKVLRACQNAGIEVKA